MDSLKYLQLASNKLSGSIPTSLFNLRADFADWTLDWNALYAVDADLDALLDDKSHSDWSTTQTVVPTMIRVSNRGHDSVTLAWKPIEYTENEGGYRVWYGTTPGGPYLDGGITANKSSRSHTVTGLNPSQDYYLAVTTETNSHDDNTNLVISEISHEVFASTSPAKPTGIKATDGTFLNLVRITFNPVAGATVYRVFRCPDNGNTCGSPIGFPHGNSFDDAKGDPGMVYYYRVKACTTQNCSKFSVANAGHRSDTPSIENEIDNAFILPGQEVPIPSLSIWGRWLLMLMVLGIGLVLVNRQYARNQ